MAVEYVMIFALGITITVGAIAAFESLSSEIASTSQDAEQEAVVSKINSQIRHLSSLDEGTVEKQLELPEHIGGSSYEIILEDNTVTVMARNEEFTKYMNNTAESYDLEGSVSGGEVTLFRTDNTYTITEG